MKSSPLKPTLRTTMHGHGVLAVHFISLSIWGRV